MKPIIYQLLPRLFTNTCSHCVPNGTIKENGSGKMNDISIPVLKKLEEDNPDTPIATKVLEILIKLQE